MSNHSPSESHPYSWEEVYNAAVLEPDNALRKERIKVAEEALVTRWLELTNRNEHGFEIEAIVSALKAVRKLKRERLPP